MQTRADMETALTNRLMVGNYSGLFPASRITQEIQDACLWAGSLFFWPSLQRARMTTAAKNTQSLKYDYYDYPPDFLIDSISRLYIDGVEYVRKAYQDFLDYADSTLYPTLSPNPNNHFFANWGTQFFVYPTYSGPGGSNNIIAWGNIQHPPLSSSTSTTIFSMWNDAGNEAIVKKAQAVLLERIDPGVAQACMQEAVQLLTQMWVKVTDELQKDQRLNHQKFIVPDYFGFGGGLSTLGNFTIPVDVTNTF